MSKVTDELLDHEYDGIREFDNPTPGWWNWLFFLTFVFSVAYFFHYHIGTGQGVLATYEAEMEEFRKVEAKRALAEAKSISEEKLAAVMGNPASVTAGKATYDQLCAACHNKKGEGLIGPNLTDEYWLHGDGSLMAIRKVVSAGVAAKGMPGWGKVLSPDDLTKVTAFIGTLRGQNVKGKEPQGQKVETKPQAGS